MNMNILGLLLTTLFGINVLSFMLNGGEVADTKYCKDTNASYCSLLDCQHFPEEASVFCPKTCGTCQICEDHVKINCTIFTNHLLCTNGQLLGYASKYCPKHCNFCSPCVDTDKRCAALSSYCNMPNVATNCPITCGHCKAYHPQEVVKKYMTTSTATSTTSVTASTTNTDSTTTTTSTTTTATTTQPTPKPIPAKDCDKLGVIFEVAKGTSTTYPGVGSCPDNSHQPSEALVEKFCNAPGISSWTMGEKVLENCSRIPHYTPIAAVRSIFGGSTVAGVFVKCEANGFQAAIQTCQSELKIYHVTNTPTNDIPSADKFVVLDW